MNQTARQDLYRLAYISRNSIQGDRQAIACEIEKILATALRNNPSKGITGALLYSGGFFCQVIEGAQDDIETLFESIQMDDRHTDVTILHFEKIDARGFDEWAMAFAGIEDSMRFDLDQIKSSKDDLAMQNAGRDLAKVLEDIVEQNQRSLKA